MVFGIMGAGRRTKMTGDQIRAYVARERLTPDDRIPTDSDLSDLIREFDWWRRVEFANLLTIRYRTQAYGANDYRLLEFLRMRLWGWRTADHTPIRRREALQVAQ